MRILKKLLRAIAAALLVPCCCSRNGAGSRWPRWWHGWRACRLWARLEAAVRALPPWAALLVFLVPVLMLLPVKLLALFLLGRGHATSAVLLLVGAKLAGTAIVARLFQLVEPALMRIPLFARWYPRWKQWKDRVLAYVRQSAPGARPGA